MHIALPVIITIVAIIAFVRICVIFSDKIHFYSMGMDNGFKYVEIKYLWKLAKHCKLEEPNSLFVSTAELNRCISLVINEARHNGSFDSFTTQNFLDKLYKYRTRIALDAQQKKGLESTKYLDAGQRLRIIFKGKGVFYSKVVNSGRELIITLPRQKSENSKKEYQIPPEEWVHQVVPVYLWRKGDANYVFDSLVLSSGFFNGQSCLYLQHSRKLERAQKRQSVRCECEIYAQMYMINSEVKDYSAVETTEGYRCLLEDISEDGAMIRIGGKGKKDAQIKIQFTLDDTLIMMYGVIRAVEFNSKINQSRLHFECTHVDNSMRNTILTYVYNVLPEEEKEKNQALAESEQDSLEEQKNSNMDAVSSGLLDNNADISLNMETSLENSPESVTISTNSVTDSGKMEGLEEL